MSKILSIAGLAALCATSAFAAPKPDCSSLFSFEGDTRLSLFNLKVLLQPHTYRSGDAYMEVREFDTDFEPARKEWGGIAIISAGGREESDDVAGGMVLTKSEAYFDREKSEALNKKGGLNAVFVIGQNDDQCAGTTYTIRFEAKGINGTLTANGKPLAKVLVSPNPPN